MRLGVLTPHNPFDRRTFSGTVFHAVNALSRQPELDVRIIGPHRSPHRLSQFMRQSSPRLEPHTLAADGSDFHDLDSVVGLVASPLLDEAAMLTDLPMIHVTDTTPGFLNEVYGRPLVAGVQRREARVLERATAVYSSRMMAKRAMTEFALSNSTVHAVPFGVNFADRPRALPRKSSLERLEILFVGGDWQRKGGDILLESFGRLRAMGQNAHLSIVGGIPDDYRKMLDGVTDITVTGFLDKNRPRHAALLSALFARAHVFVLPTRADCTPMVIAEALAHGTPVIATDVGGVREMLQGGAGRTMPLCATGPEWAEEILDMTRNPMAHAMMMDAACERTETSLNWSTWAQSISNLAADNLTTQNLAAA